MEAGEVLHGSVLREPTPPSYLQLVLTGGKTAPPSTEKKCYSAMSVCGSSPGNHCHTPIQRVISVFIFLLAVACLTGTSEARAYEFSYGDNTQQGEWRITCYTCMNVSNNEECNRYAIDRPCPQGRDYCLTLHVMEGTDADRSVLVNKRCALLEDCIGDSTGCSTSYGQTQCVSCCDEPYCNDYVPVNQTTAVFQRSSACGTISSTRGYSGDIWQLAAVLTAATLTTTVFPSVYGRPCQQRLT